MDKIIDLASSQGIWTLLSFLLMYYIIKVQEKRDSIQNEREIKYQEIISALTDKFNVIHSDIVELKDMNSSNEKK